MWRESGGSLTELGTLFRESGGSLVEIGTIYRESGGSLTKVWPLNVDANLRPSSDVSNSGSWSSTETNLFGAIDDSTPDDGTTEITVAHSGDTPGSYTCRVGLTNPPGTPTGDETHTIYIRAKETHGGGTPTTKSIIARLKQGATTVATVTGTMSGSWTTFSHELTSSEISNISSYDDLEIEIQATMAAATGSDTMSAHVTWSELELVA